MIMQGGFDASNIPPEQSAGSKHPLGNFQAQISGTAIEASKDQKSGMFVVEFTTPAGSITKRYNLWHDNPQTVEIANKQLSALCHATGIFKLDWGNEGAALRGAMCAIEVADQMVKDPNGGSAKVPNGYVEVRKVFDKAGNEPGKAPAQAQPAAWGAPAATQQAPQAANPGWGAQQQQPAPAQQQPAPNAGWTQNAAPQAESRPPWAKQQIVEIKSGGESPCFFKQDNLNEND